MRRRLKSISLELLDEVPTGYDIVFRMLPESAAFDFATLRDRARAASASALRRSRSAVNA
ncbi:RNase P protein component [Pseudoclavibacter chungangensis]|nr:RNase P protein component [Pseudoclavibacter chungangensis]